MIERPCGVMFHHFHDNERHIKGQGSIDQHQFKQMILWLTNKYNLISAQTWYSKSIKGELKNGDICLSLDDNLKCQFDIALPILEEFDLKAFWFIYTSPYDQTTCRLELYRYFRNTKFSNINLFYERFNDCLLESAYASMVEDKLEAYNPAEFLKHFTFYTKEDKIFRYLRDIVLGTERYNEIMDQMIHESGLDVESLHGILWNSESDLHYLNETGHIIGLHSHSHPTRMEFLPYEEQHKEYKKCYTTLSSILRKEIRTMSHPNNSYNSDTLDILKKMNVHFGFRSNMECGYNTSLEYPRLDHAYLIDWI